jgi:ABC-type sugar transport system ATPase subunit
MADALGHELGAISRSCCDNRHQSKVLILDEPTQGGRRAKVKSATDPPLQRQGLAVLMISSDLPGARMSDRVTLMRAAPSRDIIGKQARRDGGGVGAGGKIAE